MKDFLLKHKRLICILAPTLIGVLFIILCVVNLQQSVWFDESYGAYITRFSFSDVWNLTAVDVHPPLYYFALKIWSGIFGHTDFAMRFMSVFFGALAIIFAWAWLKRKFGAKAALLATLMMAISPMFIRYGQEMRMYTMAAAIIFASTYILQLAIDTKKRRYWIIYGVLTALGMWTHYFTALIFLAHLAYLIYTYRKKIFQKNIVTSYVIAVALYIPWIPALFSQIGTVQSGFWIAPPSMATITSYFTNASLYLDASQVTGWLLVLMLAVLGLKLFFVGKHNKHSLLLSLMAFVPPVLLLLLSLPPFEPIFVDRYLVYSVICLSLIVGVGIATVKFRHKIAPVAISAVFIAASAIGISNVYRYGSTCNDKELFEYVVAEATIGEPIITGEDLLYYDLAFYGSTDHPVYFVEEMIDYKWGSHEPLKQHDYGKITDLDAFLGEHDKVWFVGHLPDEGNLQFPRDNLIVLQTITLDINDGAAPYQALEISTR